MSEYYVLCLDMGGGRQMSLSQSRAEVLDYIRNRKNKRPIAFIHRVDSETRLPLADDVTNELLAEAGFYDDPISEIELDRTLARLMEAINETGIKH